METEKFKIRKPRIETGNSKTETANSKLGDPPPELSGVESAILKLRRELCAPHEIPETVSNLQFPVSSPSPEAANSESLIRSATDARSDINSSPPVPLADGPLAQGPPAQAESGSSASERRASEKRKYNFSDKARLAAQANLAKANLAPHDLKYRATPERLESCRRNLLAAIQKNKQNPSPVYVACFHHGLTCRDLARSLTLAGESREEFDAHLAAFDGAFLPRDSQESKLVRAAALTAWRRLRVYRSQARWETIAVEFLLAEAGLEARAAAEPGGPTEMAGLSADRARKLADELWLVFLEHTHLSGAARRLNQRLEQALRAFLTLRQGGEDPHFRYVARSSPDERLYAARPPEVTSNPFVAATSLLAAREQPPGIAPVEKWKPWGKEPEPPAWPRGDDFWGQLGARERFLRYGVISHWVRQRLKVLEVSEENPKDFAELLRLCEPVFAGGQEPGARNREGAELAPQEGRALGTNSESRNPNSEAQNMAGRIGQRLAVFRQHAEREKTNVEQILESFSAKSGLGSRETSPLDSGLTDSRLSDCRRLAAKLLGAFHEDRPLFGRVKQANYRVQEGLYQWLTACYGPDPEFEHFRSEPLEESLDINDLVYQLAGWHIQQRMGDARNIIEWQETHGPPKKSKSAGRKQKAV